MLTPSLQEKAYATAVLNPEVHGRLVNDIENVAHRAGIPITMVWTSATEYCDEPELDYTRHLTQHALEGRYGLLYTGKKFGKGVTPISMRMMALAGACVRNYIDARVMTVQDVLALVKKDVPLTCTVLLIPNFFLSKEQGGNIPSWQVSGLLSLLLNRMAAGLQTYVYIDDLSDMAAQYGEVFREHFATYFVRAE